MNLYSSTKFTTCYDLQHVYGLSKLKSCFIWLHRSWLLSWYEEIYLLILKSRLIFWNPSWMSYKYEHINKASLSTRSTGKNLPFWLFGQYFLGPQEWRWKSYHLQKITNIFSPYLAIVLHLFWILSCTVRVRAFVSKKLFIEKSKD